MRSVIIRHPRHIEPFNEPASALSVLNRPLGEWQREQMAPYCNGEIVVGSLDEIRATGELLVVSDNLWFDAPFLRDFVTEARRRGRPVRAAFRASDPAFLQQELGQITRSYERHGELYFTDLWYLPDGPAAQFEPVILASDAQEMVYFQAPPPVGSLTWWVPQRAVCPVDTWVHLFFANIVFGVFTLAGRAERRAASAAFRLRARWRALVEGKPLRASSAYVRVGRNCRIDPSTVFYGPVTIGDNVTIGPGCVISQCTIGNNVTLAHSNHFHLCVLGDGCFFPWGAGGYCSAYMEGSSSAQGAVVEMSVIGRGSYIGPGTVLTSFNLLPLPLRTVAGGYLAEIGTPVLGACVGHNCRIGAGLLIYPARTVESDVILLASPSRRVIMKNVSYEESDHHATRAADLHPRLYPRASEGDFPEPSW